MIINHRHQFIFLKTRKTAGTSMEIALSEFCGSGDVITPIAAEDERTRRELGFPGPRNCLIPWRSCGPADVLRACLPSGRPRFCNHSPADFIRRRIPPGIWGRYFKFAFERNPFDKAISRYYWSTTEPRPPISEYLLTARSELLSNWDVYTINDVVAVDFLGRYESLERDWKVVTERLGLPGACRLPRAKGRSRTNREHYSVVLDAVARERIEVVCAKEIRALGYRWQDA